MISRPLRPVEAFLCSNRFSHREEKWVSHTLCEASVSGNTRSRISTSLSLPVLFTWTVFLSFVVWEFFVVDNVGHPAGMLRAVTLMGPAPSVLETLKDENIGVTLAPRCFGNSPGTASRGLWRPHVTYKPHLLHWLLKPFPSAAAKVPVCPWKVPGVPGGTGIAGKTMPPALRGASHVCQTRDMGDTPIGNPPFWKSHLEGVPPECKATLYSIPVPFVYTLHVARPTLWGRNNLRKHDLFRNGMTQRAQKVFSSFHGIIFLWGGTVLVSILVQTRGHGDMGTHKPAAPSSCRALHLACVTAQQPQLRLGPNPQLCPLSFRRDRTNG